MKTHLHRLAFVITGLLAMLSLSSCRTTKGFGRDLQHLGSKIETEAARHE